MILQILKAVSYVVNIPKLATKLWYFWKQTRLEKRLIKADTQVKSLQVKTKVNQRNVESQERAHNDAKEKTTNQIKRYFRNSNL